MQQASKQATFGLSVFLIAVAFALLALFPYVLHPHFPEYRGLTIIRDKDYGNYYSRLQRAFSGHLREADNGITPVGSGIDGAQSAGLEAAVGLLFGWTGLPAPTLSIVLMPIVVFVSFLLFFQLFRVLEFSHWFSLALTALYFLVLFHVVSRVVHPGWSFVPTLASLVVFFSFWKKPSFPLALLAGLLFGILPYLYFWHWTFAWVVVGTALAAEFTPRLTLNRRLIVPMLLLALLISLPFFFHLFKLFQHPLYDEVAIRGGFLSTRGVESLPRSLLLALQTGFFLSLFPQRKGEWSYRAVLSLLLGVFIAMHQNLVHGRLLMFSSHFYPHVVLSSLIAGSWVIVRTVPLLPRAMIAGIALLFLAGAAYDYLPGYRFFLPVPSHFQDQHLFEPVKLLRENGGRDVVLTDAHTGRVLTSFTDDAIVSTTHARFLLISDEEMAERYCLSELFSPMVPEARRALYMEYNAVLDSPTMRERERALVQAACERVRAHPPPFLQKYGVTHILWNQIVRPDWNIFLYHLPLQVIASGNEWLLLSLRSEIL